jgi:hypothetical protein
VTAFVGVFFFDFMSYSTYANRDLRVGRSPFVFGNTMAMHCCANE